MLSLEDRYAIHELVALYSHVIDGHRWDELDRIFTDDGVFDASPVGYVPVEGLAALRAHMETANHPMAHHTTNLVVTPIDADSARVESMIVTVRPGGRAATGDYRDLVVRTDRGWRLKRRTASLRRDDAAIPRPATP